LGRLPRGAQSFRRSDIPVICAAPEPQQRWDSRVNHSQAIHYIESEVGPSSTLLRKIVDHFELELDGVHGMDHWLRVYANGMRLSRITGANGRVMKWFALLHDSCRESNGIDPDHGQRAAACASKNRSELGLQEGEIELLIAAISCHTTGCSPESNITIKTCLDADRLDLVRLGMSPRADLLYTDAAKREVQERSVSGSDWQRLLARPHVHWKKGASAMTTAAAWDAAGDRPPLEVSTLLDSSNDKALQNLKLFAVIPERVGPHEDEETTSHTDVMVLCTNDSGLCVINVEGKVDEDFGPSVEEEKIGASEGQASRLNDLQTLLGVSPFESTIRHQLLRRTAFALLAAREFQARTAVMLIHSFGSKPTLRTDFHTFLTALGAQKISPGLYSVPSFEAPRLLLAWCDGDKRFLEAELPGGF
jgi:HD superfamily phosphodiesterase